MASLGTASAAMAYARQQFAEMFGLLIGLEPAPEQATTPAAGITPTLPPAEPPPSPVEPADSTEAAETPEAAERARQLAARDRAANTHYQLEGIDTADTELDQLAAATARHNDPWAAACEVFGGG